MSRATHSAAVANSTDDRPDTLHRQADRKPSLPGVAGPNDVIAGGDEIQGAQMCDGAAFEATSMLKVELA